MTCCPACGREVADPHYGMGGSKWMSCDCGASWLLAGTDAHPIRDYSSLEEQVRAVFDRGIEVYYVKDPEVNRQREAMKAESVEWLTGQVMMGPLVGGTRAQALSSLRIFGDYWSPLAEAILIRDPVCQICGANPSKEVHHIRPRYLKGTDHPRNLIGLCLECHDEIHRRIEAGVQEVLEDSIDRTREAMTLDAWLEATL